MNYKNQTLAKTSFFQKITLVIFGLFLAVVILETGLRLGGFALLSIQEHRNRISISKKGSYRILCLGESTTYGQYPPFLEEILNKRNIGIKFSVIDRGIIGTTTDIILSRLESDLDTYHSDMVITMMGINDFGSHVPYEVISDSKAINSLKSFRVYKLIRLIWLHIVTRLKYSNQHRLFPQRIELQQVYAEEKDAQTSEALLKFKKAIELNPTNDDAYLGLGKLYQDQSRFSEAEELYKKAIEPNPKDDRIYGALEVLFREMDNLRLAREYGKKAKELRSSYYYPITTDNYNKLKAVLDKRGITYVCVQYPMRNLEPLKKIFQGNAEGIIFVDNEQLFKDVLKKTSYREYFWDMFGGEFGHCTEKGNRLLAESIANTILKEVFNK